MKMFGIFTLLFATIACATPETKRDIAGFSFTADARLNGYVLDFLEKCRNTLNGDACNPKIDLSVSIAQLDEGVLGHCVVYDKPSRRRVIELDNGVIGQYNEKVVMYHELFHCVLDRPHYDNELDIMNTYEIAENTYYIYSYWDYFVKKTFERD